MMRSQRGSAARFGLTTTTLTVIAAAVLGDYARRRLATPGIGKIGKDDGFTYRFATQDADS